MRGKAIILYNKHFTDSPNIVFTKDVQDLDQNLLTQLGFFFLNNKGFTALSTLKDHLSTNGVL